MGDWNETALGWLQEEPLEPPVKWVCLLSGQRERCQGTRRERLSHRFLVTLTGSLCGASWGLVAGVCYFLGLQHQSFGVCLPGARHAPASHGKAAQRRGKSEVVKCPSAEAGGRKVRGPPGEAEP